MGLTQPYQGSSARTVKFDTRHDDLRGYREFGPGCNGVPRPLTNWFQSKSVVICFEIPDRMTFVRTGDFANISQPFIGQREGSIPTK